MRVSRKDESIDAKSGILFESRCDCFRISNQRGAGSAANQTDPGPEIRTNLQPITRPTMELDHQLLAFRIETSTRLLRRRDTFVINAAQDIVGIFPRTLISLGHDHMSPQPKAN